MYEHKPVLLQKVIEFLAPSPSGIYFDGTLGGGGYAEAILEAAKPDGIVIGVDVDDAAIEASFDRLKKFGGRIKVEHANYADIDAVAKRHDVKFDGAVLDLGVSSHQFDEAERGFSFSKDAALDMRMDKRGSLTAEDIVNTYSQKDLEEIFETYGDERFGRRIAKAIVDARKRGRIGRTSDLEKICYTSYPAALRHGRIHPATRVFQAIRIEVNAELKNLEKFLEDVFKTLKTGGRVVVVSYHSLEDGIVKRFFRKLAAEGGVQQLTKKPLVPSDDEIKENPRSRSAKLRAAAFYGSD